MCLNVDRIRALRKKKKLTQSQAAALSEIGTKQAWSNLERGRVENISLNRLQKVAETLGVKVKDLVL